MVQLLYNSFVGDQLKRLRNKVIDKEFSVNKWSTSVKDFRGFISIDLTESALHILSFRCSLNVPSKGVIQ